MPVLWPVLGLPQACWTWDCLWLHWRLVPHPHMMFSNHLGTLVSQNMLHRPQCLLELWVCIALSAV